MKRNYRVWPWKSPYFRSNHIVAMNKNEKNPTTSVTIITKELEGTAGSNFSLLSASGIRMPPAAAAVSSRVMTRRVLAAGTCATKSSPAAND